MTTRENSKMVRQWGNVLVALSLLATSSGCLSLLRPSDASRQHSFQQAARLRSVVDPRQASFVFTGNWEEGFPAYDTNSQVIVFSRKSDRAEPLSQALAVGITPDGYLLTAGHVVGPGIHVFGWFDDITPRIQPARVVHTFGTDMEHTDLAILKVDAPLLRVAELGDCPKPGDPVTVIACDREKDVVGGALRPAAGTVLSLHSNSAETETWLINSDIPLWQGDSGGPMFDSTGKLVGITTGFRLEWHWFKRDYFRFSVFPGSNAIMEIIAEDRARFQTSLAPDEEGESGRAGSASP
jgi:S1-C subfamily serine protease